MSFQKKMGELRPGSHDTDTQMARSHSPSPKTKPSASPTPSASPSPSPVSPPPSPLHERKDYAKFNRDLDLRLEGLLYRMELRVNMYGEAANEYPPGFTPPEVIEKHRREQEAWIELMEAPTPSDCSDEADGGGDARIRKLTELLIRDRHKSKPWKKRSTALLERDQEQKPPSPPTSTDVPEPKTVGSRKRRRVPDRDEEEGEEPKIRKQHLSITNPRRSARIAAATAVRSGPRRSPCIAARLAKAGG